jgi:hypothetical protein
VWRHDREPKEEKEHRYDGEPESEKTVVHWCDGSSLCVRGSLYYTDFIQPAVHSYSTYQLIFLPTKTQLMRSIFFGCYSHGPKYMACLNNPVCLGKKCA